MSVEGGDYKGLGSMEGEVRILTDALVRPCGLWWGWEARLGLCWRGAPRCCLQYALEEDKGSSDLWQGWWSRVTAVNGVVWIKRPLEWVFDDVSTDGCQLTFVSDDTFVVVSLPDWAVLKAKAMNRAGYACLE